MMVSSKSREVRLLAFRVFRLKEFKRLSASGGKV